MKKKERRAKNSVAYQKVPLEGFSGCYVDTLGQIFGRRGKPLKYLNRRGYASVILKGDNDGKYKNRNVARLVAQTFVPNPMEKPEVNHRNGIKTDNRIENLEWVTRSENCLHKFHVLGYNFIGENNPAHLLDAMEVKQILFMYGTLKENLTAIAKTFNVHRTTVSCIVNGWSWNNITGLTSRR